MVAATQTAPDEPGIATERAGASREARPGANRPGKRSPLRALLWLAVLVGVPAVAYAVLGEAKLRELYAHARERVVGSHKPHVVEKEGERKPPRPWDGHILVSDSDHKAIGLGIAKVEAQTRPIHLELNGKTDYDQTTLNKIRPRFDNALVQKVFASTGQTVKRGDPLIEIYSADLAAAKNECRTKFVQWDHDRKYLVAREPLAKEGRITQIIWTDTQNDEKKSRLDYFVARDKLETYGLSKEEIDKLLEGLGDDNKSAQAEVDDSRDISRMVVTSPIDGVVVERDVVPGNFYDVKDTLLTISPMDQLWVWGNVFESDQDKVRLGQTWEIHFPFLGEMVEGKVESIASRVDPETHTLRIRATIPNPGKRLKSDMLVRAILQIPPTPTDTVIPRNAVAVLNGEYYAFVRTGREGDGDLFERRKLEIKQEASERVVVKKGLTVGEEVAGVGSLILAQMYEDQATLASGMPMP